MVHFLLLFCEVMTSFRCNFLLPVSCSNILFLLCNVFNFRLEFIENLDQLHQHDIFGLNKYFSFDFSHLLNNFISVYHVMKSHKNVEKAKCLKFSIFYIINMLQEKTISLPALLTWLLFGLKWRRDELWPVSVVSSIVSVQCSKMSRWGESVHFASV